MSFTKTQKIIAGILIMLGAYFFKNDLNEIYVYAYYLVALVGAVIAILAFMQAGEVPSGEDGRSLADDALLKTLARMSHADTNIKAIEVNTIQKIYNEETGESITSADIRVAARGDLYEDQPFNNYLASIEGTLSQDDKCRIAKAMVTVINSDSSVSPSEVAFFNEVCASLKLNPSDLTGISG